MKVTDSVYQYNYSHDNEGGALLINDPALVARMATQYPARQKQDLDADKLQSHRADAAL